MLYYKDITRKLFLYLTARGYLTKNITPTLWRRRKNTDSESSADKKRWYRHISTESVNRIFFHRVFHPLDIPRQQTWTTYETTWNNITTNNSPTFSVATGKSTCRITNVMAAYSFLNNLWNLLTLLKLHETQGLWFYDTNSSTKNPPDATHA